MTVKTRLSSGKLGRLGTLSSLSHSWYHNDVNWKFEMYQEVLVGISVRLEDTRPYSTGDSGELQCTVLEIAEAKRVQRWSTAHAYRY